MEQTVIWKRLDDTGMEYCTHILGERTEIHGKVIRSLPEEASFVDYRVVCNQDGNTEQVIIQYIQQNKVQTMRLQKDANHRWLREGIHLPELDGLVDIDIGATPSTNLLPIRRLRLNIGESQQMTAAWVRFPEFDVLPLQQIYTRMGEFEYEYRSLSGYKARLRTDAEGIIRDYEGEWAEVINSGH
ncbi:putative glycolipid-binding domain-containing protein [Paenibacillus azoreducens]|uniref:putative glycolipid-binding domain-containing protein n=1 Tax=Paenibacillus azoreducens TaxID=116718 RepID=UPI0039F47032